MAQRDDITAEIMSLRDRTVPWSGIVYRNCTVAYATNAALLTGEGSSLFGGRWNPRGTKTVYGSLTPETAMAECLSHFRYYGLDFSRAMPRLFVAVGCELRAVLDLSDGAVRQRLQVSQSRMLGEDWRKAQAAGGEALTQRIGRVVCQAGLEGLLVPSAAAPDGTNLVWFPENVKPPSRVILCNADQLPRWHRRR
jgi:RES domain-containing protein